MNGIKARLQFHSGMRLPLILQDEIADCGHACVAMISNFWGHALDLQAIRQRSQPSQQGVTLLSLKELLESLSFNTRALTVPMELLNQVKTPAILHWNMNHFVVLKRVKRKTVIIHDPARGVRTCTKEEVSKAFTGIVLEVEKSICFQAIKQQNKLSLLGLVSRIKGIKRYLGLLISLSLSIEVLSLLHPLLMQYVMDDVISISHDSNLSVIAGVFSLFIAIQVFMEYVRGNMVTYLMGHLNDQFSTNIVKHLFSLPLDFFEKRHKGDILAKFQSMELIQKKISTDFVNAILDGLLIIMNLMVMLIYSQLLTSIVLISLVSSFALRYGLYWSLKQPTESAFLQHAQTASLFLETLQGILPIKVFSKESSRVTQWRNSYIAALNADIKIARNNLLHRAFSQLIGYLEPMIVVCVGASLVIANSFSLGMLVAFLSYRLMLANKSSALLQNLLDYQLTRIRLNRLSDLVLHEPEITEGSLRYQSAYPVMSGSLVLKNIYFRYHAQEEFILEAINLSIQAGEKVVITGPSACGKSTLLKVMMGLLPSSSGEIYVDGQLIQQLGLKNFRQETAAVMQEDSLLSGSIFANISFFDETLDVEWVYEVAKLACIHQEIIQFKMGYETLVGEMGSTLSGGQKQRILLARALYKRPKILFLDEATSHLDIENEKKINASLKALKITQVIIAHREESIQMADRVVNLGV